MQLDINQRGHYECSFQRLCSNHICLVCIGKTYLDIHVLCVYLYIHMHIDIYSHRFTKLRCMVACKYIYIYIYMYIHKHICAVIRRVNLYEHIDIRIYKHTQEYMDKVYIWIIQKVISYYNTYNLTLQS